MAFIYDIICNTGYPFDNTKYSLNTYISDINVLVPDIISEVRCTDMIISRTLVLISFIAITGDSSSVYTVNEVNPVINKKYAIKQGDKIVGSIIFKHVPEEQVSYVNMDTRVFDDTDDNANKMAETITGNIGVLINKKCYEILSRDVLPEKPIFGIKSDSINMFIGGSLKAAVDNTDNVTTVTISPIDNAFVALVDATTPMGFDYGFIDINGIRPDAYGNINIVFAERDTHTTDVIKNKDNMPIGLMVQVKDNNNLIRCNTQPLIASIRCSVKDGTSIAYPLDDVAICGSNTICKPEWERGV